jgi:hypothetical protein
LTLSPSVSRPRRVRSEAWTGFLSGKIAITVVLDHRATPNRLRPISLWQFNTIDRRASAGLMDLD